MDRSDLAKRMKRYENVSRTFLVRRVPVIVRLDGRSFHTFTQGFKTPFDDKVLLEAMRRTMLHLCQTTQGCVFGYTQSDEITLILTDYRTIHTDAFFEYNVQKVVSTLASEATREFNKLFDFYVMDMNHYGYYSSDKQKNLYMKAANIGACFDCRVFNVPLDDVCNNIIWRQQDCTRNSIQSVGQHYFSDKELYKKNSNDIQDMLMTQKNVNWNDFPTHLKRGTACVKMDNIQKEIIQKGVPKIITVTDWVIDKHMPILTKDRNYVESRVFIRED